MFLIKSVLRMVHAKNYETVSTFVKVMQKKPWPLFFLDTVYFVFLVCFYLWNNTETVILVWPHVSDCILCWPFGQYSSVITYVMLVIVCWLINSLK